MVEFAKEKAKNENLDVQFYLANFVDFRLKEPVDFIYIMLGSLYVNNTEELLSHFSAVEQALKPGGLYFLDWCIDFSPLDNTQDSWVMRKDGITVTTLYTTRLFHAAEQLYEENILFTVKDHGIQKTLAHRGSRRAIFPQEFVLATTKLHHFELLGWWNDWNWKRPLGGRTEIIRPSPFYDVFNPDRGGRCPRHHFARGQKLPSLFTPAVAFGHVLQPISGMLSDSSGQATCGKSPRRRIPSRIVCSG